ncbi:hypothetical protein [Pseudochelatococcus sp. B33]
MEIEAVSLVSPHFEIGDQVVHEADGSRFGIVRGAFDDKVWVEDVTNGIFYTRFARDLRLAVNQEPIGTPPPAPYITGVEERTGGDNAIEL